MPTNRLTRTRSSNARAQKNSPRSKRQSANKGGVATQAKRSSGRTSRSKSRTAGKKGTGRATTARGAQKGQEIPRNQWTRFLDRFSREHDGWLARVDVSETGTRGGTEARLMPLLGISIDMKPRAKDTTSIMLDVRPNVHLTHWVPKTRQIIFDEQEHVLHIASSTGDRAIVRLEKGRRR